MIGVELPAHRTAVLDLCLAAFGGLAEGDIITRLDRDCLMLASRVAFRNGRLAGHILFSRLPVTVDGQPVRAAALGPMAVVAGQQRQGIGTALVEDGLRCMAEQGVAAVIVLGHPAFYRRFGFCHDLVARLESPFTELEAFMGLELVPGSLGGRAGTCTYPVAWGL